MGHSVTTEDVNVRPDRGGPTILIHGPWPRPLTLTVGAAVQVGRLPDNDAVLEGGLVSRHHAVIIWATAEGRPTLEDLGSANGTLIEGKALKPGVVAELADGTVIEIGGHRLGVGRPAPAGPKPAPKAPAGGATISAEVSRPTERLPRQQPSGRSDGIGYVTFNKKK